MTNPYDRLKGVFRDLQGAMSNPEAFYTVLAAAVVADGYTDRTETAELDALVHRTRTLRKLEESKPAELADIRSRVDGRIAKRENLADLVADAARTIAFDPENKKENGMMAWAVYAHAADIVFADSKVVQQELEFLMKLAEHLSLPVDQAEDILEFLRKKNAY